MTDDRRLIEDFLPIQAISKEASREKSVRKGHISTLHLWWARRPLVACRAAVYGALVPASRFIPDNGPDNKKQSLGRANVAKFIERLCKYPGNPNAIQEAQRHILEAHAERLTRETGKTVTVEDIEEGKAPRPKLLDMFAGGGAIPLEALRLGCEANALDLNPVAHIIQLCTLVYPQKYGKPNPNVRGMTGPKNAKGETTWKGLIFSYGQNVELDGQNGLAAGSRALVEKKKGKYRLLDFAERGEDEKLGMPRDDGKAAPLIDILHRILWLVENEPRNLNTFLDEARPDRERLRLVAQALAGTTLSGKKDDGPEHTVATTPAEQAALKKLVANWRALIDLRLTKDPLLREVKG